MSFGIVLVMMGMTCIILSIIKKDKKEDDD